MDKLEFLLGSWKMESIIPKSSFSEEATGVGEGTFKRALDGKYVFFDYTSHAGEEKGQAHGVFAWDEKIKTYRFWWFENSGNFSQATCKFIDNKTLYMIWHDSLLTQTFKKINENKIILRMENPKPDGVFELLMEVIFFRK